MRISRIVIFRYWFNVPQQEKLYGPVVDNQNIEGIWVYHCHILRHEDCGMMMVVQTQKNTTQQAAKQDAKKAREAAKKRIKLSGSE